MAIEEIKNKNKLRQLGFTEAVSVDTTSLLQTKDNLSLYLWNLPPHESSLPIDPATDPLIVQTATPHRDGLGIKDRNSIHPLRRGRIYWYSRVDSEVTGSRNPNSGDDPRYGFQFLWNPNTITTSVAVNMDITPTAKDQFVKVVGAFPSGEYLTVSCVLDRTNDFFAIKSLSNGETYAEVAERVKGAYSHGSLEKNFNSNLVDKLTELQRYGTLADVEYLYKAINGPGWRNLAITDKRDSSDIGFLAPTLLKIEIGPLAYIGYVQNLNVTHTSFTKSMIPLRTEISLQFNLMATAGLSTTGV